MSTYSGYDWTMCDISFLGVINRNPGGWLYWSIGMSLTGIFIIPIVPYLYNRLVDVDRKAAKIGCAFFYLAGIGLFFLGLFPQNGDFFFEVILHPLNGGFALGGLFMGMFIMEKLFLRNNQINRVLTIIMITILWSIPAGFLISQGYSFILDGIIDNTGPWFLHFSTWEWMLLFGIFSVFLMSAVILPAQPKGKVEKVQK
jgi:hypothetical membrane protein